MRNAGARVRREQEPAPPPAGTEIEAELRRAIAETDAVIGSMRRRDAEMTGIVSRLETLGAECGNAGRFALLADKLSTRQAHQVVELISAAEHVAEARDAAEQLARAQGVSAALRDAWIAEGRRREAEERDQAGIRPAGTRVAGRGRHLKLAGGAAVKATAVAAAAAITATTVIASQDSASVRHWAAPRPAAVRLHVSRPDSAVPFPLPRSPSPRPSAAAVSASPAPPGPPGPVSTPAPPARVPAAPAPVLSVQRLLELGGSTRGQLPMSVPAGGQAAAWTARATDGITLSSYAGVVAPGQEVTLEVTDPSGGGGWIYISAGRQVFTVRVTSDLGIPQP